MAALTYSTFSGSNTSVLRPKSLPVSTFRLADVPMTKEPDVKNFGTSARPARWCKRSKKYLVADQ